MPLNDTSVSGVPEAGTNLEIEFELFDQLPKELRDVLNYCPIKATVVTLHVATLWGECRLRKGIFEQWKKEFRVAFPDYQLIKGDDFPVE